MKWEAWHATVIGMLQIHFWNFTHVLQSLNSKHSTLSPSANLLLLSV